MPNHENFAQSVNGRQFAFWHAAHQVVNFNGGGNDKCACAPVFASGFVNRAAFGKIFAVRQLFLPGFLLLAHGAEKNANVNI